MSATPDLTSPKPAEGAAAPEERAAAPKPRGAVSFVQERFKGLVAEYGPLLFVVYFSIFGLVFVGSALAIQMGFEVESAAATAGVWTAAYVFTKVLQPLRIAATVVLTPLVAAGLRRVRKQPAVAPDVAPDVAPAVATDSPAVAAASEPADAPESASGRQR
jgi:hypothetical protein